MAFLTRFTDWFVRTDFYIGFCSNLPQPLNNPYFDVLVIVIALIMVIMGVWDGVYSAEYEGSFDDVDWNTAIGKE